MVWEGRSREAPPYPDLWPIASLSAMQPTGRFGVRKAEVPCERKVLLARDRRHAVRRGDFSLLRPCSDENFCRGDMDVQRLRYSRLMA